LNSPGIWNHTNNKLAQIHSAHYGSTMDIEIKQGQGPLGHLTIYASVNDQLVGYLELKDPRPGLEGHLISHIEVHPELRRRGIATALFKAAKNNGINPIHAIDKTPEGDVWSKAVGD
jgi:ribosomal protein S18 acetylase RimI-like enzyme